MSIAIGIYDFFAYTLPGGFYLFLVIYGCSLFGIITFDYQALNDVKSPVVFVALASAYILGLLLDPLARYWSRVFIKPGVREAMLERYRQAYPDLEFNLKIGDRPMLMAYFRSEDKELVSQLERSNVLRMMLRNFSLSFVLFAVINIVAYITRSNQISLLLLGAVFIIAAVVAGLESVKFGNWFHESFYQVVIASALEASDWVERKPGTRNARKARPVLARNASCTHKCCGTHRRRL